MEKKTARLTVLLDPSRKSAFEKLCRVQDLTPSQVMRQLIREFVATHQQGKSNARNSKSA